MFAILILLFTSSLAEWSPYDGYQYFLDPNNDRSFCNEQCRNKWYLKPKCLDALNEARKVEKKVKCYFDQTRFLRGQNPADYPKSKYNFEKFDNSSCWKYRRLYKYTETAKDIMRFVPVEWFSKMKERCSYFKSKCQVREGSFTSERMISGVEQCQNHWDEMILIKKLIEDRNYTYAVDDCPTYESIPLHLLLDQN